eukprot:757709-Hanusia_phi.AAC.4
MGGAGAECSQSLGGAAQSGSGARLSLPPSRGGPGPRRARPPKSKSEPGRAQHCGSLTAESPPGSR